VTHPLIPTLVAAHPSAGPRGDLHIYAPDKPPTDGFPFVLGIHGGAWTRGDQSSYSFLPARFHRHGIAVVLASYRLAPGHIFPTAMDDLFITMNWIARRGRAYHLNPARGMVFGGSAGGHLAMLLAAMWNSAGIQAPLLRGVAAYCGIMDLTAQFVWDEARGSTMTRDFMGGTPSTCPDHYAKASPMMRAHLNMPPVWMTHGDSDEVVPVEQSRKMHARLLELGGSSIYHEVPDTGHTMLSNQPGKIHPSETPLLLEDNLIDFCRGCLAVS